MFVIFLMMQATFRCSKRMVNEKQFLDNNINTERLFATDKLKDLPERYSAQNSCYSAQNLEFWIKRHEILTP